MHFFDIFLRGTVVLWAFWLFTHFLVFLYKRGHFTPFREAPTHQLSSGNCQTNSIIPDSIASQVTFRAEMLPHTWFVVTSHWNLWSLAFQCAWYCYYCPQPTAKYLQGVASVLAFSETIVLLCFQTVIILRFHCWWPRLTSRRSCSIFASLALMLSELTWINLASSVWSEDGLSQGTPRYALVGGRRWHAWLMIC